MIKQHHLIYVPARLGSTRLKKKVLMDFLGEPLVVRTLKMLSTLKDDQCVFDVVLNTESEIIAEEVKKHLPNQEIFIRDAKLASNMTTTEEILANFISIYDEKDYDYVSVINPTSPLLSADSVQKFLRTVTINAFDTSFSTTLIKKHALIHNRPVNYSPFGPHPRTQDVTEMHILNWSIVSWNFNKAKAHIQKQGDSLYVGRVGFITTPDSESIDIDTPEDFKRAVSIAKYMAEDK